MTIEQQYLTLIESLRLLALPSTEQVQLFPDYVSITDEIAASFGDAYLLAPQLQRAGKINQSQLDSLKAIDDWFEVMPQDGSIASMKA